MAIHVLRGCRIAGGFSLVELAVVLAVLTILLGTVLAGGVSLVQRARFSDTRADIKEAAEAILGFAYTYGRLPCPDLDGDGVEVRADCDGAGGNELVGELPGQSLGLAGSDPWGTPYAYAVDASFADDPSPDAVSFTLTDTGDLDIHDLAGTLIADEVVFVLFSRGPNQYVGTADTDRPAENENNDGDEIFVNAVYSETAGNIFDDVIDWMSANVLKAKMVQAGRLP